MNRDEALSALRSAADDYDAKYAVPGSFSVREKLRALLDELATLRAEKARAALQVTLGAWLAASRERHWWIAEAEDKSVKPPLFRCCLWEGKPVPVAEGLGETEDAAISAALAALEKVEAQGG